MYLGPLGLKTRSDGQIKEIPYLHSVEYDLCSIDKFSSQMANKFALTVFAQLTHNLCQILFVPKLTQVRNPGHHHCPLVFNVSQVQIL